jgi:hypothetical protein
MDLGEVMSEKVSLVLFRFIEIGGRKRKNLKRNSRLFSVKIKKQPNWPVGFNAWENTARQSYHFLTYPP